MIVLADAPPLIPDADEARRWVEEELARPEYTAAEPTLFDRVAQAIGDFLAGLFTGRGLPGFDGLLAIVVVGVAVLLLVAAFLIWGRPRTVHRSRPAVAELFGTDQRSAAQLRTDADARVAAGDWDAAVVLRFRALARALAERGIVDPAPGATVHGFARQAARAFPSMQERLDAAAAAFDDVRYLRRPGTAELFAVVAETDDALAALRPAALADVAEFA
ncbi:MAG: DUF4129 domain-containing protein [Microbacterium sp.]|uniref:DUF4129 domain-containing protein n=1 Tax=Microbacterium sp. TaxID=51671 RepID=UPI003A83C4BB